MQWSGHPVVNLMKKSMETETDQNFPVEGESHCSTNEERKKASEERDKSKSPGLWESQSVIQTGKLTLRKVVWD